MKIYNTKKEARQALRHFKQELLKLKKQYGVTQESADANYPVFNIAKYCVGNGEIEEANII
jgi:hypothetical protein